MLAIFVLYSLCNACQWIQYSIVSNVVERYYGVSSYAVDWTSIVYMITYCPLVLPATAFMDYMGLKKGMLVGAALTALGSWIKCVSVEPTRFALTLAGQTVVAVAQVFVLGVPPQLASAWFGSEEVATACSLGVFGNMLGIASSFVVTPLLVRNHEHPDDVERDLARLFYITAAFATIVFLLIASLFQERPPLPPSPEAAARAPVRPGCLAPLRRLLRLPAFCLLMAACAINVAAFSALSTLLNQLVLVHYKDGEEFAGRLGLVLIVGSMVGSVASGIVLDRTHKFKETTLALFALALLAMVGFTFALPTGSQALVYAAVAAVGCFMGGYMPVGFEFASELTFPESENSTAGVLMAGSQVLAVGFTVGYAWLLKATGDVWANLALSASLVVGAALSALIRPDLRRQAARASALRGSPLPRAHAHVGPDDPGRLRCDASDSTEDTDVDSSDDKLSSPPYSPAFAPPPYAP
ncbi:Putative MFS-type transporter C09D4.1 [Gryllus bimaculatus]|nr:Putative MFS-type transporter C09D4.1 [Gryllus bimaculatus]